MTRITVNPADVKDYPPNIRSQIEKPSETSMFLGLEIRAFDKDAGEVEVVFNAGQQLTNKWGGIHGGMVAAMIDELISLSSGLVLDWGQIVPTLELKTSFLDAARPGPLTGIGRVVKRGKSIGFVEAELRNGEGTLLATGSGTVRFVTLKRK